ncbi:hypothetical protein LINGRAHAP2_LOCUS7212 [Linum grandiflorum]
MVRLSSMCFYNRAITKGQLSLPSSPTTRITVDHPVVHPHLASFKDVPGSALVHTSLPYHRVSSFSAMGLTLDIVGLYLPKPVFSPGQLYLVVSRVRSVEGLHILLGNSRNRTQAVTRNIVFHEIFEDLR